MIFYKMMAVLILAGNMFCYGFILGIISIQLEQDLRVLNTQVEVQGESIKKEQATEKPAKEEQAKQEPAKEKDQTAEGPEGFLVGNTTPSARLPDPPEESTTESKSWWYHGNTEHHPVEVDSGFKKLLIKHKGIYQGSIEGKSVYLTFDEGYENGYTDEILDILREEKVPAAFFITGTYLQKNPGIIKRMAEEGHLVCNHSVHHYSMPALTKEMMAREILDLQEAYLQTTGREMDRFFRPPNGEFSELSLWVTASCGYYTVFWSFAYRDWETSKQKGPEYAFRQITGHSHPGAILLLHAVSGDNAGALRDVIQYYKRKDTNFQPLLP